MSTNHFPALTSPFEGGSHLDPPPFHRLPCIQCIILDKFHIIITFHKTRKRHSSPNTLFQIYPLLPIFFLLALNFI